MTWCFGVSGGQLNTAVAEQTTKVSSKLENKEYYSTLPLYNMEYNSSNAMLAFGLGGYCQVIVVTVCHFSTPSPLKNTQPFVSQSALVLIHHATALLQSYENYVSFL